MAARRVFVTGLSRHRRISVGESEVLDLVALRHRRQPLPRTEQVPVPKRGGPPTERDRRRARRGAADTGAAPPPAERRSPPPERHSRGGRCLDQLDSYRHRRASTRSAAAGRPCANGLGSLVNQENRRHHRAQPRATIKSAPAPGANCDKRHLDKAHAVTPWTHPNKPPDLFHRLQEIERHALAPTRPRRAELATAPRPPWPIQCRTELEGVPGPRARFAWSAQEPRRPSFFAGESRTRSLHARSCAGVRFFSAGAGSLFGPHSSPPLRVGCPLCDDRSRMLLYYIRPPAMASPARVRVAPYGPDGLAPRPDSVDVEQGSVL